MTVPRAGAFVFRETIFLYLPYYLLLLLLACMPKIVRCALRPPRIPPFRSQASSLCHIQSSFLNLLHDMYYLMTTGTFHSPFSDNYGPICVKS